MKIYELFKNGECISNSHAFFSSAVDEARQKGALETILKDGYEIRERDLENSEEK